MGTPTEHEPMLNARANQLIRDTIKISTLLLAGLTIYVAYPVYTILFEGDRPLLVPIHLPFTDPVTPFGYGLNTFMHTTQACSCFGGNIGLEITFLMVLNCMWTGVDLIKYELNQLNNSIHDKDIVKLKFELYEIFQKIGDLDTYIDYLESYFYLKSLIQPFCLVVSISACCFCTIEVRKRSRAYDYQVHKHYFALFNLLVNIVSLAIWTRNCYFHVRSTDVGLSCWK